MGAAIVMVLTTSLSRLRFPRQRNLVMLFMVLMVLHVAVAPFLLPMLIPRRISRLRTTIDDDGICLQSTGFTCGPAASVAVLWQLGFEAEE